MRNQFFIFLLTLLIFLTARTYAEFGCKENFIEEKFGELCEDRLRIHWLNDKKLMCSNKYQRRLCCKFCTETQESQDTDESKDVLMKRILDILESSERR